LYAALARRRPRVPALGLVLVLVLVLWAGAEEVLWRWFALAEAASRIGFALGLALTSAAFAAVHRNRSFGHAVAGGVFGLVFAATGTIVAAWAAHAAYNLLVAGSARGRLPPLSFSDTGAARAPE
jgi:membrane protease YdiL (CAAX protease family)